MVRYPIMLCPTIQLLNPSIHPLEKHITHEDKRELQCSPVSCAMRDVHYAILLVTSTYIAHKDEQYRLRHEAIVLGGRSNIALNASYKRNVRLPQGKEEADDERKGG